ncbi:MAG: hypothetical protein AAF487_02800 [Bacteroidota bacterium]
MNKSIIALFFLFSFTSLEVGAQKKKKGQTQGPTFGSYQTSSTKEGKQESFWPNGNKKTEYILNKKLFKEGAYQSWYENGNLHVKEMYRNGRRVGKSEKYFENGKKMSEGNYALKHKISGELITALVGNISSDAIEVLHGPHKEWHENGKLKKESIYDRGVQEGEVKEYHENGYLMARYSVVRERKEGNYERYFENGETEVFGYYERNEKEGKWKEVYQNGQLKFEEIYKSDKRINQKWSSYHPNGELMEEGLYVNARKNGPWKAWHDNGQQKSGMEYREGMIVGKNVEFYANGNKKWEGYYKENVVGSRRGKRDGIWMDFHENGQMMRKQTFVNGYPEGKVEEWYASGNKKFRSSYVSNPLKTKDSMLSGASTEWYDNGQIKSEGVYWKGVRDGEWKEYTEEGQVTLEAFYDRSKFAGDVTKYYATGEKKSTGTYLLGKKDLLTGEFKEWYINGNRKFEGNYIKGEKSGICRWFYKDGQLQKEAVYEKDNYAGFVREFYPDGSKKIEGEYAKGVNQGLKNGAWKVWNEDGELIKNEKYKNGRLQ